MDELSGRESRELEYYEKMESKELRGEAMAYKRARLDQLRKKHGELTQATRSRAFMDKHGIKVTDARDKGLLSPQKET